MKVFNSQCIDFKTQLNENKIVFLQFMDFWETFQPNVWQLICNILMHTTAAHIVSLKVFLKNLIIFILRKKPF